MRDGRENIYRHTLEEIGNKKGSSIDVLETCHTLMQPKNRLLQEVI